MAEPVDPRLVRLVRALDEERTQRIKFERLAGTLRTTIERMQRQRTADAKTAKREQRPRC
jgi:hypothetical protein